MISCQYLYDTTRATGACTKRLWVDGTASQSWNRKFWLYLLDCTNPEYLNVEAFVPVEKPDAGGEGQLPDQLASV